MKQAILFILLLVCVVSCTKEPYEDLTTSFEGIVYASPNEPMVNGRIVIVGRRSSFGDDCCGVAFRKTFKTESDGTFDIRVTTDDVASFSLDLSGTEQRCSGSSITSVCAGMISGENHENIIVYAYS